MPALSGQALIVRHRVVLRRPGHEAVTIEADENEYVLQSALDAGIDLPYRCLQGWCLTCAARLLEGEVDQRDARRYYPQDWAAGYILPCTARPRSDLVIDTHQREAMRRNRDAHRLPYPRGDWGRTI